MPRHPASRHTISLEEAEIISHRAYSGDQYIMRLDAADIARAARPGSFVHLRCDPALPMRRPMSIMRADAQAGSIFCIKPTAWARGGWHSAAKKSA